MTVEVKETEKVDGAGEERTKSLKMCYPRHWKGWFPEAHDWNFCHDDDV